MKQRDRMLDLFAGAGAGAVGFDTHFDVVEAVERDRDAATSYEANHHGTRVHCLDFLDYWAGKHDFEGIRGVLATPPCQGFSLQNRKRRAGHQDADRNGLTGRTAELVAEVRPDWCVFENVPQVNARERERAEQAFKRLGYTVRSLTLNAADYGAAQRRKRWILVATRPGRRVASLVQREAETVRQAFQRLPSDYTPQVRVSPEVAASFAAVREPAKWVKTERRGFADTCRLAWDQPAPAVTNVVKNYLLHPDEDRPIDVPEALVLFGLPGTYYLHGNKRSRAQQTANMVPAPLAGAIAEALATEAAA